MLSFALLVRQTPVTSANLQEKRSFVSLFNYYYYYCYKEKRPIDPFLSGLGIHRRRPIGLDLHAVR